jgi:hypothetical protein
VVSVVDLGWDDMADGGCDGRAGGSHCLRAPAVGGFGELGEDTVGDGSQYPDSRSLTGLTDSHNEAEEIAEGVS